MGDACTADAQCAQGRCVDGVCCKVTGASCPLCQACNVAGSKGTCSFVGAGNPEPHKLCPSNGACGNTGACAADQTCAKAPASQACGTASCVAGVETPASMCDGAGNCAPTSPRPCDPYVCGASTCLQKCATDADCTPGNSCQPSKMCKDKGKGGG